MIPTEADYAQAHEFVDRWHREDRGSYVRLMDRVAELLADSRARVVPMRAAPRTHNGGVDGRLVVLAWCECGWNRTALTVGRARRLLDVHREDRTANAWPLC